MDISLNDPDLFQLLFAFIAIYFIDIDSTRAMRGLIPIMSQIPFYDKTREFFFIESKVIDEFGCFETNR